MTLLTCPKCADLNAPDTLTCSSCSEPLTIAAARAVHRKTNEADRPLPREKQPASPMKGS